MACVRLDVFFQKVKRNMALKLFALFAAIQTLFELLTHIRFWNIDLINTYFKKAPLYNIESISKSGEHFYVNSVNISLAITFVALGVWVYLTLASHHNAQN